MQRLSHDEYDAVFAKFSKSADVGGKADRSLHYTAKKGLHTRSGFSWKGVTAKLGHPKARKQLQTSRAAGLGKFVDIVLQRHGLAAWADGGVLKNVLNPHSRITRNDLFKVREDEFQTRKDELKLEASCELEKIIAHDEGKLEFLIDTIEQLRGTVFKTIGFGEIFSESATHEQALEAVRKEVRFAVEYQFGVYNVAKLRLHASPLSDQEHLEIANQAWATVYGEKRLKVSDLG